MNDNLSRPDMQDLNTQDNTDVFSVRLNTFEGPLDLLLHLVKINEVDIYDIPVADITRQYMDYLAWMKYLNLEVAGEFLVMAATLAHIKSRMLLPPENPSDELDEEEDPRMELVQQLLEYKKFKEAAGLLKNYETVQIQVWTRGAAEPPETVELIEVSVFDLMQAMSDVFARIQDEEIREIIPEEIKIEKEMENIIQILQAEQTTVFSDLFKDAHSRYKVLGIFLAILELVRIKKIRIYQAKTFGEIYIRWRESEDER